MSNKDWNAAEAESFYHYRCLVQSVAEAIVTTDARGSIIDVNDGFCRMFEYSEDEALGLNIIEMMPERFRESRRDYIRKAAETGVMDIHSRTIVASGRRIDGTEFPMEMSLTQWEREGNILFTAVIRDVTERERYEKLRKDTERIVRHDLRSPLNGILGGAELLSLEEGLTEEQREYVDYIMRSGKQMLRLIEHSLDIIRMEEGTYELKPAPCNVCELLGDLSKEFERLAGKKGCRINFLIDGIPLGEAPCPVFRGEYELISLMMANLIKNAVEASPERCDITVKTFVYRDVRRFEVHNFGVIPEEVQPVFFERYSTSGKEGGTGLGTYSAKLMADVHGGEIGFESTIERGTTVWAEIPLNL
ncbi:PAS domain-containing sensor histidine kinase [Limisalsivibrio acetivorans]|uniref:PAS domain-containing sensor histidine kinase n=1 Tax=Limisalsivibrio acetivorans TaxID=1304888 RepID=UPI0003B409BB|nr:PAS domain-containing sensor histidine kinase [Limisalsivibrio acetivorans]